MAGNNGTMVPAIEILSLDNFPEHDSGARLNSPRSLKACAVEGINPDDLTYKPMERFAEANLSPRLCKLRFDFFEAKRKDLTSAARRQRKTLMDTDGKTTDHANLPVVAAGAVKLEHNRFKDALSMSQKWLRNVLRIELNNLQTMTKNAQDAEKGNEEAAQAKKNEAKRQRDMNEARRMEDERKTAEKKAQMDYERQQIRMEHAEKLRQLAIDNERSRLEKKERAERDKEKADAHRAWQQSRIDAENKEQQDRVDRAVAMAEHDRQRQEIRARGDEMMRQKKQAQTNARHVRWASGKNKQEALEQAKADKEADDEARAERRMQRMDEVEAERAADVARKQMHAKMHRDKTKKDNQARLLANKNKILSKMRSDEMRLVEHEQRKQDYLRFARELNQLQEQNKQLNVSRKQAMNQDKMDRLQRDIHDKDQKTANVQAAKQRLWTMRQKAGHYASEQKAQVQGRIMQMRINSKFDDHSVEQEKQRIQNLLAKLDPDNYGLEKVFQGWSNEDENYEAKGNPSF